MVRILVPLGFLSLITGLLLPALGKLVAVPLTWLTELLVDVVHWFGHFPRWNYRIPGPPFWLIGVFLAIGVVLASEMRREHRPKPFS